MRNLSGQLIVSPWRGAVKTILSTQTEAVRSQGNLERTKQAQQLQGAKPELFRVYDQKRQANAYSIHHTNAWVSGLQPEKNQRKSLRDVPLPKQGGNWLTAKNL